MRYTKFFIGPRANWRMKSVSGLVSTMRSVFFSAFVFSALAFSAEKPTLTYKAPPPAEGDRPVMTNIVVGPQGTDFGFKLEFNQAPWGDQCKTRCANATLFLDTDNNKTTGLKLADAKAAETGADLAITIQGARDLKEQTPISLLRVKVKQFSEDSTSIDQGNVLVELDNRQDTERVVSQDNSVYLLIDANIGTLPIGPKLRVIYHPPDSAPLIGFATGLGAAGASRIEVFKDGKLTNPVRKK